jgi:hypothetical protein
MADIELVIKIPEEMMSYINKNEFNAISEAAYGSMAMLAIQNGTPLPKGHGNLIQREEAETIFRNAKMALYKQSRTERIKDFQTRESMLLNAEQFVHLIKPIIEADNER